MDNLSIYINLFYNLLKEIAKNLILNFMDSYQITKEDALTKLNTFLTLSCIYNIIPEQIEEVKI